PGTADVRAWVHRQLGLLAGGNGAGSRRRRGDALAGLGGGQKPAGASVHDLIFGTIGLIGRRHPAPVNATKSHGTTLRSTTLKAAVRDGAAAHVAGRAGFHCSLRAVTAAGEALNFGEFDLVLAGGVAKGALAVAGEQAPPTADTEVEQVRVYDASPTGTLPG